MAMGRRKHDTQEQLFLAPRRKSPGHPFFKALNALLAEAGFDPWLEQRCLAYYEQEETRGQPSIPPGVYFRMLFVGYFEGIDSQRGIAWRCADSRSLERYLGLDPDEETPDHSSMTRIRKRLPAEVFDDVFQFVLRIADDKQLLSGKAVGVDSTTLEANAAMKSIVRRETGEDWKEYVVRLMREEGEIGKEDEPSDDEVRRFDKRRKNKRVSNTEWVSETDPDSEITQMKDGRTHLAYKAEHVVDLDTEIVLGAEIYPGTQGDASTLADSVTEARANLEAIGSAATIEEVAADKGYHSLATLELCDGLGYRTYIPEREQRKRWDDKTDEQRSLVLNNRKRVARRKGKDLQRRRSEVVERSFAHCCETGGGRRSWLRGKVEVTKRYLMTVAAHNLGRILWHLFGAGKPRAMAAGS